MGVRISPPVPTINTMIEKIKTYFEETYHELVEKVSWPTWAELQGSAVVVMVASLIIAVMILAMDSSFKFIMENLYKLAS
ncbi:MAG: preprotein translocase subunit SecE [Bacteroidota bacterium]|jgi:preprotein translocase subunit SecE